MFALIGIMFLKLPLLPLSPRCLGSARSFKQCVLSVLSEPDKLWSFLKKATSGKL